MKWKISWLNSQPNKSYDVSEEIIFDKKMFSKVSNIVEAKPISVVGTIKIVEDIVHVNLTFKSTLVLICANTTEQGEYQLCFTIDEPLEEEDHTINYKADYIDLYELVWQRLIVEVPSKFVISDHEVVEGKSWKLMSEDEYNSLDENVTHPGFEKLKNLSIEKEEE